MNVGDVVFSELFISYAYTQLEPPYLEYYNRAKRDSIYDYLKDVLPQNKTREQQLRMVGDLLNAMREECLIYAEGRTWYASDL